MKQQTQTIITRKAPKRARVAQQFVQKQANKQPKAVVQKITTTKITPAGRMLRRVGGIAGGFLGNAGLGKQLGAGISRIFGQGDYTVSANTLVSGGPPSFSPLNAGIRITHREYVTDVYSSTNYNVSTYRLQPNATQTFPWLHQLAGSFEQYKLNGVVVYLNTTSGNAVSSTNNALGVWGVTTVYDPSRPPLSSKVQAEEYAGCTAGVPSLSILHPVECKPKSDVLDRYYIDYTNSVTGENLKFYDHGLINVFTQGQQQAGVALGELWISYDITFYNPRVQPTSEDNVADHYKVVGNTVSATNPVGTATVVTPTAGSNLGTTIVPLGAGAARLNLPSGLATGNYLLMYMYLGGNTVASPRVDLTTESANIVPLGILGNTQSFWVPPMANPSAYCYTMIAFRKTDTALATILVGNGSNVLPSSSASTYLDLFVIPLGSAITMALEDEKYSQFEAFMQKFIDKANNKAQPDIIDDDDSQIVKLTKDES